MLLLSIHAAVLFSICLTAELVTTQKTKKDSLQELINIAFINSVNQNKNDIADGRLRPTLRLQSSALHSRTRLPHKSQNSLISTQLRANKTDTIKRRLDSFSMARRRNAPMYYEFDPISNELANQPRVSINENKNNDDTNTDNILVNNENVISINEQSTNYASAPNSDFVSSLNYKPVPINDEQSPLNYESRANANFAGFESANETAVIPKRKSSIISLNEPVPSNYQYALSNYEPSANTNPTSANYQPKKEDTLLLSHQHGSVSRYEPSNEYLLSNYELKPASYKHIPSLKPMYHQSDSNILRLNQSELAQTSYEYNPTSDNQSHYSRLGNSNLNLELQTDYDENHDRDEQLAEVLNKQTIIMENLAKVLEHEHRRQYQIHNDSMQIFKDLLEEVNIWKKRTEEKEMETTTIEPIKQTKPVLPTVMTQIDETEVRKALRADPLVRRILKMAEIKKKEYEEAAKKYYN